MNLREYQLRALETDQHPNVKAQEEINGKPAKHEVIPLLGLVGEVGGLLSEYKKMLRDAAPHEQFSVHVEEELGDILWYVANVATKFDLNLEDIAKKNIYKTEDRWHEPNIRRPLYDANLHENQKFPRSLTIEFQNEEGGKKPILKMADETGAEIGAPLTDNSYEDDGYRFHDVMHLTFMTMIGWSPVIRKLLRDQGRLKHRPAEIDEAEDSGRPQVIEEGIVFAAYAYAIEHGALSDEELTAVDWTLLKHIKTMTLKLEVRDRSAWEWNEALVTGFKIWAQLIINKGGKVNCDLEAGEISYQPAA